MTEGTLHYLPTNPRTGVAITVRTKSDVSGFEVRTIDNPQLDQFRVPVLHQDGWRVGQFSIAFPGKIEVVAGGNSVIITVEKQRDLEFGREFGVFSIAVVILVGGMLLWLKRRKRVGSF